MANEKIPYKIYLAEELAPIFCEELIAQELDNDTPYVDIPEEIQEYYKTYRPAPLMRAYAGIPKFPRNE